MRAMLKFLLVMVSMFPLMSNASDFKNVAVPFEFLKDGVSIESGVLLTTVENGILTSPAFSENKRVNGYLVVECKKNGGTIKSQDIGLGSEIVASQKDNGDISVMASFYELESNYKAPDISNLDLLKNCNNVEPPNVVKYSNKSLINIDNTDREITIELGGGYAVTVQIKVFES